VSPRRLVSAGVPLSFNGVCWSEKGWLLLSFVDPALLATHLDCQTVGAGGDSLGGVSCARR
jgi:hypothetical protein